MPHEASRGLTGPHRTPQGRGASIRRDAKPRGGKAGGDGEADEVDELRIVQRVTVRGTSPMNINGDQPSLTQKRPAAA